MLDAPADVPAVWVGLALVAAALLGAVTALPTAPPPDAAAAANAVDRVAAGDAAAAERRLTAASIRVGPDRIALRSEAGRAGAAFAFGPVTPAGEGPLERVLRGRAPGEVFADPAAFERAAAVSRGRAPTWRPADRLLVRRVNWGSVSITLVGAA